MCSSLSNEEEVPEHGSPSEKVYNGTRLRDQKGFRQRAAAVCARLSEQNLEILLVSGRSTCSNYWVLPGGGVEITESTEQAVVRELREEAGIQGRIVALIGKFIDEERFHHTTLYLLVALEMYDVWEDFHKGRVRRWMCVKEAINSIKHSQLAMVEQSVDLIVEILRKEQDEVAEAKPV